MTQQGERMGYKKISHSLEVAINSSALKQSNLKTYFKTKPNTTFQITKMASAGNKSVVSDDMQELRQGQEDISNAISGHKANISNPSMLSCSYSLYGS